MNDKDKKAFENWFRDYWSFETINKEDCFNSWLGACDYAQKKSSALDALSLYDKLEKEREENIKLREALEFYSDCWKFCGDEDCVGETKKAREALNELGKNEK